MIISTSRKMMLDYDKKITVIGWRGIMVYYEILVSVPRESV